VLCWCCCWGRDEDKWAICFLLFPFILQLPAFWQFRFPARETLVSSTPDVGMRQGRNVTGGLTLTIIISPKLFGRQSTPPRPFILGPINFHLQFPLIQISPANLRKNSSLLDNGAESILKSSKHFLPPPLDLGSVYQ